MDMFFDTCHVLFVKGLLIPVIGFVLACGNLGSPKIQLYIRHAVPLAPSKFPKDPHQPL